jgi:hypothetical protein
VNVRDALGDAANPKQAMAKRFFESEMFESYLWVFAQRERQLVERVRRLEEAHGVDHIEEIPEPGERVLQVKDFAGAMVSGDAPEWGVENLGVVDNPDEAVEYVDMDGEAWSEQKAEWADLLRENDEEGDEEELADRYVRARFGVPLAEFERAVVEWDDKDRQTLVEEVLAGGFDLVGEGVDRVLDEIDEEP